MSSHWRVTDDFKTYSSFHKRFGDPASLRIAFQKRPVSSLHLPNFSPLFLLRFLKSWDELLANPLACVSQRSWTELRKEGRKCAWGWLSCLNSPRFWNQLASLIYLDLSLLLANFWVTRLPAFSIEYTDCKIYCGLFCQVKAKKIF